MDSPSFKTHLKTQLEKLKKELNKYQKLKSDTFRLLKQYPNDEKLRSKYEDSKEKFNMYKDAYSSGSRLEYFLILIDTKKIKDFLKGKADI